LRSRSIEAHERLRFTPADSPNMRHTATKGSSTRSTCAPTYGNEKSPLMTADV
jgi:hypothetical protein